MEFNVADLIEAAVDRVPDREAIVCGPDRRTYAQLDARANRLAHYFQSLGLQRGNHIGIYGFNSLRWVEAMLAAYKIRAVPINVNYRYVEDELFYLFDNADLVALTTAAGRTCRSSAPWVTSRRWPRARRRATSRRVPATIFTCCTPAAPRASRRA
jgi:acyl-CoA synthetase (AMP-forming)/AMP-acid ligase II